MRAAMRVLPNAVVLSSLLLVAGAGAQPAPAPRGTPAPASAGAGSAAAPAPAGAGSAAGPAPSGTGESTDLSAVRPEDMPTAVRLRRLEQKTQALKERAWQLKARVQ